MRVASCERAAQPRGVEVRLVRRLPAVAAGLRGRAARRWPASSRSPTSRRPARARSRAHYDLSIVEGSITTAARRRAHPRDPRPLAAADHDRRVRDRRRHPGAAQLRRRRRLRRRSSTPARSTSPRCATRRPPATHVAVDFELKGCPPDKGQLLEVISAYLNERRPQIAAHSVCIECKRRGNVCVMVAHGTPCLGPVTHAGCGALCPSYHRGCYGCFGPMEAAQRALAGRLAGQATAMPERDVVRLYRTVLCRRPGVPAESETRDG